MGRWVVLTWMCLVCGSLQDGLVCGSVLDRLV